MNRRGSIAISIWPSLPDAIERLDRVFPEFRFVNEEEWPAAYVLRDDHGRELDFHPLTFDRDDNGWPRLDGRQNLWPHDALKARG